MNAPVRTTCPYCGVGCGILVGQDGKVAGDAEHPANHGRLCSKGSALGETFGMSGRLLHPQIDGRETSWDEALDAVAQGFRETIANHGPDAVALYVSGQLLTEDYYVANKLAKGFLGTANIDTNSRLCMSSSVAGHRRAFGEDLVPGAYDDLDCADLVILVGSNAAWCHPILFQRIQAARERRGTRLVVIDPRRSATAAEADLHISARAGTDVLLFNGLLAYLDRVGAIATDYIARHTSGFAEAHAAARADSQDLAAVAEQCAIEAADLARFYDWFATTPRTVTAYSQGVNQSSAGTDKVNAIINCHFATGRIGRPGMGPLSLTGQPNAMGGREVGGLANQLAAHMSFDDPSAIDRVRRFWNAPNMATRPGLTAIDMFDALAQDKIKAIWIIGTNPAVSMPDAGKVRAALARCPLVIVSDCIRETDTAEFANILLPAASWGEKDGTVTNSERRISRQRAFATPPGEARRDWRILAEVGKRLGFAEAFAYASAADVFREHAALSAFENGGDRVFDIGGLGAISDAAYDNLEPVQWPIGTGTTGGRARLFDDAPFPTPDRRGHFVAVRQRAPRFAADADKPLILNTGRLRDQWHTMTRTGQVPRLAQHMPEPLIDINPQDAARYGVRSGDLARVSSDWGTAVARIRTTTDQPCGSLFLPMHWTEQFAADCVIGRPINPATDPVSYQPELKHTPVAIERIAVNFEAILVTRRRLWPSGLVHWSRRKAEGCEVYTFRGPELPQDGLAQIENFFVPTPAADMIEYRDFSRGIVRQAWVSESGLEDCLFIGPVGSVPAIEALFSLFETRAPLDPARRSSLLSGRIEGVAATQGPVICGCHQVGLATILEVLAREPLTDVRGLGQRTRAGTNCGSCIPELKQIIAQAQPAAAE